MHKLFPDNAQHIDLIRFSFPNRYTATVEKVGYQKYNIKVVYSDEILGKPVDIDVRELKLDWLTDINELNLTTEETALQILNQIRKLPLRPAHFNNEQYLTQKYDGGMLFTFPNGYAASVIKHEGSYGYSYGLWEIAIMNHKRHMCDNPITDDVLGYLSVVDVEEVLKQIRELPKRVD